MYIKSLWLQTIAGASLMLTGCEVAQNARADLNRLTSSNPFATRSAQASATPTAAAMAVPPRQPPRQPPPTEAAASVPPAAVSFTGKSEQELQALLGPPTNVEERAPGKIWRYRDRQCTLDVQLFPDVQTRQFGTLAYEVKSDVNTDEGNRACLAQFQSRARAHG